MTDQKTATSYRERLLPGVSFFAIWLMIIPAVALVMTPIASQAAIPVAVGVYVIVAVIFFALSPVLEVRDGKLRAGNAEISTNLVGEITPLGDSKLRAAIGPGADARNHLVIRGWIHSGIRAEITDPADPTPAWIITTRKPIALADAIAASRGV